VYDFPIDVQVVFAVASAFGHCRGYSDRSICFSASVAATAAILASRSRDIATALANVRNAGVQCSGVVCQACAGTSGIPEMPAYRSTMQIYRLERGQLRV